MGVKITDREYFNPNTASTVDWLIANVGDWQKVKFTFESAVEFIGDLSNKIEVTPDNKVTLLNGSTWSNYGFLVGQSIIISHIELNAGITTVFTRSCTIDELNGDIMIVSGGIPPGSPLIMPSQLDEDYFIYDVLIYADVKPQGIEVTYGDLTNIDVQSDNLSSIIDGSLTKFIASNIDVLAPAGTQSLINIGFQSGMAIKTKLLTYVVKIGTHTYKYELELEFMMHSIFDNFSDLENNIVPDWLLGANCLTDNISIKMFPVWNNPNSLIKNELVNTRKLGNTGYFNENYNGFINNFTVESLTYQDSLLNFVEQIDYSQETLIKAVISGVSNLDANSRFQFGFIWITTDETIYKEKNTPFHENLKVCSTKNIDYTDYFALSGSFDTTTYIGHSIDNARMNVKDIKFSTVGLDLMFEATFIPTPEFTTYIDSLNEFDRKYILWVSVADSSLDTNFSDRVSLRLDFNTMVKNIVPAGPIDNMEVVFYQHPDSETHEQPNVLYELFELDGYIEDDILCRIDFPKPLSENRIFQKFIFKIDVKNLSTNFVYNLSETIIDVSQFVIDLDGVQQINYDGIRGFKLESGNNKNYLKAYIKDITVTDVNYRLLFGFKIRWEDWIRRLNVPLEFYDNAELQDGFNNDWIHYQQIFLPKRLIMFSLETENILDGDLILNRNEFDHLDNYIADYDSTSCLTKTHNFYRHSDNTNLNIGVDPESGKPLNVILSNELTRIEIDYTLNTPSCNGFDSADLVAIFMVYALDPTIRHLWGTICIEIDKGAGQFEFRQLSSHWGSESDNPLIPLETETKLKIELLPDNITIRTSCLIDPGLLPESSRYKVTGRLSINAKP